LELRRDKAQELLNDMRAGKPGAEDATRAFLIDQVKTEPGLGERLRDIMLLKEARASGHFAGWSDAQILAFCREMGGDPNGRP
jgi:hypothetical protein